MPSIQKRYEKATFSEERLRHVIETLRGFVDKFERGNEDTFKNLRLGFVQGAFEQVVSRASIFFYLQFEGYVGQIFGWEVATYWSLMVAHNLYLDMQDRNELGRMSITDSQAKERKMRRILDDPEIDEALKIVAMQKIRMEPKKKGWTVPENFYHFYNGRVTNFGGRGRERREVTSYDCALSRWLVDTDYSFKFKFGIHLAQNTEAAIMAILDDLETGRGKMWADFDFDDGYTMEPVRWGEIYSNLKREMDNVDMWLIMNGERPRFSLPRFGI